MSNSRPSTPKSNLLERSCRPARYWHEPTVAQTQAHSGPSLYPHTFNPGQDKPSRSTSVRIITADRLAYSEAFEEREDSHKRSAASRAGELCLSTPPCPRRRAPRQAWFFHDLFAHYSQSNKPGGRSHAWGQ